MQEKRCLWTLKSDSLSCDVCEHTPTHPYTHPHVHTYAHMHAYIHACSPTRAHTHTHRCLSFCHQGCMYQWHSTCDNMISYKWLLVSKSLYSCPFYALLFSSVPYLNEIDHSYPFLERAAFLSSVPCFHAPRLCWVITSVTEIGTFVSAGEAHDCQLSILGFWGSQKEGELSERDC